MAKPEPFEPQSVGERIAHARRLLGLREGKDITPAELASRVGVSQQTVYNWEGGTSPPARGNLTKLAQVLRVSEPWIVYGIPGNVEVGPHGTDVDEAEAAEGKAGKGRRVKGA